ncbi:6-bladed beta-propeller [candidate division KSB1 bacterium]
MLKNNLSFALLVCLLILNCESGEESNTSGEESYSVEEIDGIRHVHNITPAWGDEPKVSLEFVRKIGGMDKTDENYILFNPRDILIDDEDNIYVLDTGNFRIQKYDSDLNYLRTIGRQGQGPGEFDRTRQFHFDKDGNIVINDYRNRRFVFFSKEGESVKTVRVIGRFMDFSFLESGDFITWGNYDAFAWRPGPGFENASLLIIFDLEGNLVRGFGKVKKYSDYGAIFDGNNIRQTVWKDNNIYVMYFRQNKIEKYRPDGTLIFTASRELNYELDGVTAESPNGEKYLRLPTVSFTFGVDGKGRIWVKTYIKQPDDWEEPVDPSKERERPTLDHYKLEVFDNDGNLLGNLECPVDFNIMRICEDRIFLIDNAIEQCICEYKIVEK